MPIVRLTGSGLDEIKDFINPNRINKQLAIGVGIAVKQLHRSLVHATYTRYNIEQSKIENSLVGGFASNQRAGRGFILDGLTYRSGYRDLAKFPYTKEWGKINRGYGFVHSVTVVRGQTRVVYGKDHRGGFTARNGSYGIQMFERTTNARYPLRLLFGPSIVDMLLTSFNYSPEVRQSLDTFEQTIANNINLR